MNIIRTLVLGIASFTIFVTESQADALNAAKIADARQMYDGVMLPDVAVNTFAHTEKLFPVRVVRRGPVVRPLPTSAKPLPAFKFNSGNKTYDVFDYLALNRVAGLLVIKNGEIVAEDYALGIDSSTHWVSFSIAKSFASTLIGAAIQDGFIKGLDDTAAQYLPELSDSAYAGVTVRNLLQMASAVRWDETYTDPKSDRRKLLDRQLTNTPGNALRYMRTLTKAGSPGTIWNYNTGETILVGALLEAATKKPLADYLSEKIWAPWGMESDANWWLESPNGLGVAGSGLLATMRDFGRFGLFVLNDGVINGKRVVPEGWFAEATGPKIIGGKAVDYGYFWWPIPKGDPIHNGAY